jgi:uncharacterized membrane protein
MKICPQCGTEIPANGSFCPSCGRSALTPQPLPVPTRDRVPSALCYFFLPAVVFLFLEPFKRTHFIRFHAFQALFVWPAMLAMAGIIKLVSLVLLLIPSLGQLTTFLLWILFALAVPIVLLLLISNALMGAEFELPVIGHLATTQAGNTQSTA